LRRSIYRVEIIVFVVFDVVVWCQAWVRLLPPPQFHSHRLGALGFIFPPPL
jgi:hypothetical protein